MLILIDNYDSFTYNLVQYFGQLKADIDIYRNDAITAQSVIDKNPSGIVISPGPGTPEGAGICLGLTSLAAQHNIPLIGICLGHQTIGQAFGGKVVGHSDIVHGKTAPISHCAHGIFADLPQKFVATRYHSLVVDQSTLPPCLDVTAWLDDGTIMGVQHRTAPVYGVQFHPESIASEHGHQLLQNFLNTLHSSQEATPK